MKKNNMLRIASVLLVAVLLSTCAISGAFAKYTTSDTADDTARVALFGANVVADNVTFFSNEEDGTVNSATAKTVYHATDDLVAPGTSGEASGIEFSGESEVAVAITYSAEITLTGWSTDGGTTTYCPIIFTVNGTDYEWDGTETAEVFADRVAALVANLAPQEFAAGTDLSTATVNAPAISWRWAFDEEDTDAADKQTNAADTLLGKSGTAEITIEVTATINQIN